MTTHNKNDAFEKWVVYRACVPHGDGFIGGASEQNVGIRQKLDGVN